MNEQDQDPLPPSVIEALRAERARPGVDAETRVRLRARLHASLLAGPSGGSSSAPATAEPPEDGTATMKGPWKALRAAHPGVTAAVGFAIGLTIGVAAHAWVTSKAPEIARVALPAPSATSVTVLAPPVAPEAIATPASPRVNVAPAHSDAPAPAAVPSASSLTAERALLDIAHSALANGDAAAALSALGRHAGQFPHGVYREEREALTIQSLRALGRSAEATRRATAFETHYPNSLFRATVDPAQGENR